MWPSRSERLLVGVSATQIACRIGDGPQQLLDMRWSEASPSDMTEAILDATFDGAGPKIRTVSLVVGASVARHWLQQPVPGLRSFAELRALVQSRAQLLFGLTVPWTVAGDWKATNSFVCAAVPQAVESLATELAQRVRASRRLTTSLCAAMGRHIKADPRRGWTIVAEPEAAHLMHVSDGQLDLLRTLILPPGAEGAALKEVVDRQLPSIAALGGGVEIEEPEFIGIEHVPAASQAAAACQLARSRSWRDR